MLQGGIYLDVICFYDGEWKRPKPTRQHLDVVQCLYGLLRVHFRQTKPFLAHHSVLCVCGRTCKKDNNLSLPFFHRDAAFVIRNTLLQLLYSRATRRKYGQFCVIYLFNLLFASGSLIYCHGTLMQVMMNSMNVPSKRSTLEKKLDKLILALFATLFTMCVIGAIGR